MKFLAIVKPGRFAGEGGRWTRAGAEAGPIAATGKASSKESGDERLQHFAFQIFAHTRARGDRQAAKDR
jgi:hypothetical protein